MIIAIYLFLIVLFLIGNAIFHGAEAGFVCLGPLRFQARDKEGSTAVDQRLAKITRFPERFLALTLVGINLCLVVTTALCTSLLEPLGPLVLALGIAIISGVIFVGGEVISKMVFSQRPVDMLLRIQPLIRAADVLLAGPVSLITRFTRLVMRRLNLPIKSRSHILSREELVILATSGIVTRPSLDPAIQEGQCTWSGHQMVRGIFGLTETLVREIMVPRRRIVAVATSANPDEVKQRMIDTGFSRLPVYDGTIDQMLGVVYFKDLFLKSDSDHPWHGFVLPPLFVPEVMTVHDLLREMRNRNHQAALVLNEFGSFTGMVTLEDVLEEVVGEIQDEFDPPVPVLARHEDGTISTRADMSPEEFSNETGIRLPATEDVATINGMILKKLGRIPVPGEVIFLGPHRCRILEADSNMVQRIRLSPATGAPRN
jgi:putative hemolysin